jgi:hypothetical protein
MSLPFTQQLDSAKFHPTAHESAASVIGKIVLQLPVGMLSLRQLAEMASPPPNQIDGLSDVNIPGDRISDRVDTAQLQRHWSLSVPSA